MALVNTDHMSKTDAGPNFYEYLQKPQQPCPQHPQHSQQPGSNNVPPVFVWGHSCDADEVMVGMWIGSEFAGGDHSFLKRKGIRTVINISGEDDNYLKLGHIKYEYHPFKANANYFESITQCVYAALIGGPVLLHCEYGDQQSPIIMAALLMRTHGKSASDAIKLVQGFRPGALKPDIMYLEALLRYAKQFIKVAKATTVPTAPTTVPTAPTPTITTATMVKK